MRRRGLGCPASRSAGAQFNTIAAVPAKVRAGGWRSALSSFFCPMRCCPISASSEAEAQPGMVVEMGAHGRPEASCGVTPGSTSDPSFVHVEYVELASARGLSGHKRGAPEPAPGQHPNRHTDAGCEGGAGVTVRRFRGSGRISWRRVWTAGVIALPLLLVALGAPRARGATTGIIGGDYCGPVPTFQTRECGSSGDFLDPPSIGNALKDWTTCIKKKCAPDAPLLRVGSDPPESPSELFGRFQDPRHPLQGEGGAFTLQGKWRF